MIGSTWDDVNNNFREVGSSSPIMGVEALRNKRGGVSVSDVILHLNSYEGAARRRGGGMNGVLYMHTTTSEYFHIID